MSLFKTLPRETQNILRQIDMIGKRLQEGIRKDANPYKLYKLEEELTRLCGLVGIELDDVLDIYVSNLSLSA